jgi:hypothetical protein
MLSSSGALVSEAQPDKNQATASALIMNFIGLLYTDKVEKQVILLPPKSLAVTLRIDCGIWQSCYKCDLGAPPGVFKRAVAEFPGGTPGRHFVGPRRLAASARNTSAQRCGEVASVKLACAEVCACAACFSFTFAS